MHLRGWDYYADRDAPWLGLTRTAQLIAEARDEAAGDPVLLLDNGDAQQGTPLGDRAASSRGAHPFMTAVRHLGYDALGLGNHDFNFGIDALARCLDQAPCPVICSNAISQTAPPLRVRSQAILHCSDLKIGLLAMVPPQTLDWDRHLLEGQFRFDDIATTARRMVPDLREAGCNLIVVLAHTGLGPTEDAAGQENAARVLARIPGIDAIIAGHTHQEFPGPDFADLDECDPDQGTLSGTPLVMPGVGGSCLGVIDLWLTATEDGCWQVTRQQAALRRLLDRPSRVPEDPTLVAALDADHEATRTHMNRHIGWTDHPLHSYFAQFAPDEGLRLVATAQAHAVRAALSGSEFAALPVLSAVAPSKSGGRNGPWHYTDIPAGPLSFRNIADLHVFPNDLRAVILNGDKLADWLEMSASLFHQLRVADGPKPLINPRMPGHNFDVIHGVTYAIDLRHPPRFGPDGNLLNPCAQRIQALMHNGSPIQPDDRFIVAVNNYRINGGGNVRALNAATQITCDLGRVVDILSDYVASGAKDPLAEAPFPWRFLPIPDAEGLVATGPNATPYLPTLADRLVRVDGPDAAGFLELTLRL